MTHNTRDFFHILQVEQLAQLCLEDALRPLGMTAGQYLVMSFVAAHEPLSSAELSRKTRKTAQSMGEYVKTLELKGWLQRRDDPQNRRVLLISTTKVGKTVLGKCEVAVDAAEQQFFSCLKSSEMTGLRQALVRIRSAERRRRHGEQP